MNIFWKLPEISKIETNHLYHSNPWWEKELNRLIKREKQWLKKFKQDPEFYFVQGSYSIDDYSKLFQNINHFLEFYNSKMKLILEKEQILNKFSKWINTTAQLVALCHFLINTIHYFVTAEQIGFESRRQWIIDYNNEFLLKIYERFKHSLRKITTTEQHEVLDQIYKNEDFTKTQLINPMVVLNFVVKYVVNLTKKKQMTFQDGTKIYYQALFLGTFFIKYLKLQQKFLQDIV